MIFIFPGAALLYTLWIGSRVVLDDVVCSTLNWHLFYFQHKPTNLNNYVQQSREAVQPSISCLCPSHYIAEHQSLACEACGGV
jgi:hypothetical protein